MAISFPISFPTIRGIMTINWRAVRADMLTSSPMTFAQQVIQHQGQRWEADVTLPPMDRAEAEEFTSFLLKLDGRNGSFTLTPPEGQTPRGAIGGTPIVAGASQTGSELSIDGCSASITGYLLAGDYIQVGSGATARLHKVLVDVDTDGGGAATLDIWPKLRESPTDNATVVVSGASGLFRLTTPVMDWSIDDAAIYGIAFSITEKL